MNKMNKQDYLDVYNILFWLRANEPQKAQNILEQNKELHIKVYKTGSTKRK